MNHVDAERNSGVTFVGNDNSDVNHIRGITKKFQQQYPELADRYNIEVRKLANTEMPNNSDHAPFVYNIDEDESDGKKYGRAVVCYALDLKNTTHILIIWNGSMKKASLSLE